MIFALAFLVLIEQQSPGLTPASKLAFLTAYDQQLALRDTVRTYPLADTPSAAVAEGDDLIVAEGAQLVRYAGAGASTKIGAPLDAAPSALAFGEHHDLFAASTGEISRIDMATGAVLRRVDFGERDYPVADFDLDAGGCVAFIAFGNRLARIDLCAAAPALQTLATDGFFSAVRILPNGRLLVAARNAIEVRDRDGALLVRYDAPAAKLALEPSGTTAVAYADAELRRVDVATGVVIAGPTPLAQGIYVRGMAVPGEWRAAAEHRRRVSHP